MLRDDSVGKKIVGFVIFAFGLILCILLIKNAAKDFPIWVFGRQTTGVVEKKWYELVGENNAGELAFDYFLSYKFASPNGETLTGSTSLAAQEWMAHEEGGEVDIIYASFNPSINRVDDSRFRPLLACSYIPFILIVWFSLVWGWNILSEEFKRVRAIPMEQAS